MKLNHKSSILTVCGVLFIIICMPMIVRASPPPLPPPGDYVATSCDLRYGTITSGTYQSTWYNDGQYLKIKTNAAFVIFGFQYTAGIYFYFGNYNFDKIKFDFIDTIRFGTRTVSIKVVYETGDPDYVTGGSAGSSWPDGYVSDGYYEYDLDHSRKVSYVSIHFYALCWEWPERYLKIDMIRLTIL